MLKFHETASKHFPQLLSNLLKKHAFIAWFSNCPDLVIESIILYKYHSKQKRYAVVIEVSDIDQRIYQEVRLIGIEGRRPLITEDLARIYKEVPSHNFKDEWIFFVKLPGEESHCLIADPQKPGGLISILIDKKNEAFEESEESIFDMVGIHEPHLILYQEPIDRIRIEKHFAKIGEMNEIKEELENLEQMKPVTIMEWDVKNKEIEKLKSNLKHYENYFRPKKAPEAKKKLRADQEDKIECQKIAKEVWKEHLLDIKYMIMHPDIKKIVGKRYKNHTVHGWLSEVAEKVNPHARRKGTRSKDYIKEQLAMLSEIKREVPKK